jgi:hypothetical protein
MTYLELEGETLEEVHEKLGEWILSRTARLEMEAKLAGSAEPIIYILPRLYTPDERDELENELLIEEATRLVRDVERQRKSS